VYAETMPILSVVGKIAEEEQEEEVGKGKTSLGEQCRSVETTRKCATPKKAAERSSIVSFHSNTHTLSAVDAVWDAAIDFPSRTTFLSQSESP